jgi:hypothetical protein
MQTQQSGGIGFIGLLTIAFIVLKLTEQIDWSWWWVLAPIWISALFGIAMTIVLLTIAVITVFVREK